MRTPAFAPARKDAFVAEKDQLSSAPEPLDAELSSPPALVGVRGRRLLWMIGALALFLRLALLPFGHAWDTTVDYNVFIDLAKNHSPYDTFTNLTYIAQAARWGTAYEYYAYPPVPLYIYYPLAKLYILLHPTANYYIALPNSFAMPNLTLDFFILFKAPIWIADFLLAALLARISGTVRGFRDYLLNPYVLLISGAWTFDAIMVLGLVAGIYAVYKGKMFWAGLALAFGTMVKFFPAIIVPTVLFYLIKKKRPFKEIALFLATYCLACLIFLGPFLQGVLTVLNFHGSREGGGMTWEYLLRAVWLFPISVNLPPISDAMAAFGTPTLVIVMLLVYWYIWRTEMTLNRMVIVTLLGFFVGSKLVNEQYALMIFPFVWLEAYRLQGAWRWIYRLFWIIPLTFAIMNVPISHFFLTAYHMVFQNQAVITVYGGFTGFDWTMFPWMHAADDQLIAFLLGLSFFGLSLTALFWPVRWPKRLQHATKGTRISDTQLAVEKLIQPLPTNGAGAAAPLHAR
jgi:hypothetical protein